MKGLKIESKWIKVVLMAVIIWNLVDCNDQEGKIKEMEVSQK
jgi:hypothetical protein